MNLIQASVEIHLMEMNIKAAKIALDTLTLQVARFKQQLADESKPVLSIVPVSPVKTEPAPEPPTVSASAVKVEVVQEVKEELVFTEEWSRVLDILNNSKENIFLTGGAGTGKSTLLDWFVNHSWMSIAVVAPTGIAALRVKGETIHRFFGFPAAALDEDDIHVVSDSRRAKYKNLDMLIIDEASMIRADVMDAIDRFMRLNGKDRNRPFGGCRVVLIGDLYQLPPVSSNKDEKKWLIEQYGTDMPFFMHANVWRNTPLKVCELTTIFRQKDPQFTECLNAIRKGAITPEHLALVNSRVNPTFKPNGKDLWLTLTTTNDAASQANMKMIDSLPSTAKTFEATISGDFNLKDAPTDVSLTLKPGATVIFIKNSPSKGWVNGTMGRVVSVEPLIVDVRGEELEVEPETWDAIQYIYDEKTKKLTKDIKGKFIQIPLRLAAAITIHRSQGTTLDRVIIDLGKGAFAAGMSYVALSRCRSLDGIMLRRPLKESDLIVSNEVVAFMTGKPIARPSEQLSLIPGAI